MKKYLAIFAMLFMTTASIATSISPWDKPLFDPPVIVWSGCGIIEDPSSSNYALRVSVQTNYAIGGGQKATFEVYGEWAVIVGWTTTPFRRPIWGMQWGWKTFNCWVNGGQTYGFMDWALHPNDRPDQYTYNITYWGLE